jgi:hypothetical protein
MYQDILIHPFKKKGEKSMNRNDVIVTLREAARAHKQWVTDALALIQGVPLDKEKVPVNSTECSFGKWYYGDGQNLRELQGFKEIEDSHDKLHRIYMEIFAIIFGEVQGPSFFNRLFGLSHKIAAANREAAMEKFHLLEQHSDTILKQLLFLEKIIMALGDKQLEKYGLKME